MINQAFLDLGTVKSRIGSRQICPSGRFRVEGAVKSDKTERVLQAGSFLKSFNISAHKKLSDHDKLCPFHIDRKLLNRATHNLNRNRGEYTYVTLNLEGR